MGDSVSSFATCKEISVKLQRLEICLLPMSFLTCNLIQYMHSGTGYFHLQSYLHVIIVSSRASKEAKDIT